jgi:predicted DNA binding CopG/RHH family protein
VVLTEHIVDTFKARFLSRPVLLLTTLRDGWIVVSDGLRSRAHGQGIGSGDGVCIVPMAGGTCAVNPSERSSLMVEAGDEAAYHAAGWRIGTVQDFLEYDAEEAASVEVLRAEARLHPRRGSAERGSVAARKPGSRIVALDSCEKHLEAEVDGYVPVSGKKRRTIEAALEAARKATRLSIRISESALVKLKGRARDAGIPYQALVSEILKQYLAGRMRDVKNTR